MQEHGRPPVMFVDVRPLERPMLVIANNEVAEQVTKASTRWISSTPKSPTLKDIHHLTGHNSILTDEVRICCQPWKNLSTWRGVFIVVNCSIREIIGNGNAKGLVLDLPRVIFSPYSP